MNTQTSEKKTHDNFIQTAKSISKQAKVLEILEKDPGMPVSKAMIQSGYSINSARTPSRYVGKENLLRLFNKSIPDKLILKAHKKLLNAKTRVRTFKKGDLVTEITQEDTLGLSKGVELAYKVKGAFAPEEKTLTVTGLESKGDDELGEIVRDNQSLLDRASQFKPNTDVKPIEGAIVAEVID